MDQRIIQGISHWSRLQTGKHTTRLAADDSDVGVERGDVYGNARGDAKTCR
jgi:hypothetical protein